jgi:hypothetical protein
MYVLVFASPTLVLFSWAWFQFRAYANDMVYATAVDDSGIRSLNPELPPSFLSWAEVATLEEFNRDIRIANRALTKTVVLSPHLERYEDLLKIILEKGHFAGYQDKVLPLPTDKLRIGESALQISGSPPIAYASISDIGVGFRSGDVDAWGGLGVYVKIGGKRIFLDSGDMPIPVIYRRLSDAWTKESAKQDSPDGHAASA